MKKKQLTAILLSAVLSLSVCLPASGISALAAEDTGTLTTAEEMEAGELFQEEDPGEESVDLQVEEETEAPAEEDCEEFLPEEPAAEEACEMEEILEEEDPAEAGQEEDGQIEAADPEQVPVYEEAGSSAQEEAAENPADVITGEPEKEKVAADAMEAATATFNDFDSAEDIELGDTKEVTVTEDKPYYYFRFVPEKDGTVVFSSASHDYADTYAVLYDAEGEWLDDNDDGGEDLNFRLTTKVTSGETYYYLARLWESEGGTFSVSLTAGNLCAVSVDEDGNTWMTVDPRSADSFTLTPIVDAADESQLRYSWKVWDYEEGEEVEISTDSSLSLENPENDTRYSCTVSDQTGYSQTVTYEFRKNSNLTVWPEGLSSDRSSTYVVLNGQSTVTLTALVQADEGTGLSWYWLRNDEDLEEAISEGTMVAGGEAAKISFQADSAKEGDEYGLQVSDDYGNSRGVYFYIVESAPDLRIYPDGASEDEDTAYISYYRGNTVWLYVSFAEDNESWDLSYDWRDPAGNAFVDPEENWSTVCVETPTNGQYSCTVTDIYGQSATVYFVLQSEHQEWDPTEKDLKNAAQISVGDSVDVSVTEDAPVAWFRFTPEADVEYELYSEGGYDTYATLYDSSGEYLYANDDGAGNLQFSILYPFTSGNNYYFGVRQLGGGAADFTIHLVSGERSDWLSDFDYQFDGDAVVLTWYNGDAEELVIPGSATARGHAYDTIRLRDEIWGWDNRITSLSFEKGVVFSEHPYLNSLTNLAFIDLSEADLSEVEDTENMFQNCGNLQEIRTPLDLTVSVTLPGGYVDTDGNLYSELPLNMGTSLTLTKAETSEWLNDYNYQIKGNTIKLGRYHGPADVQSIKLPGSAAVAGRKYSTVELSRDIWVSWYNGCEVEALSFEEGVVLPEDCAYLFEDLYYLKKIDLRTLDWSKVTNLQGLFSWCRNLEAVDLSPLRAAENIEDISSMFGGCNSLETLDLSGLHTQNVEDMSELFYCCNGLTSLKLDGLDTGKVTDMRAMFYGCEGLTSLDLSGFDTTNVETMYEMFYGCTALKKIELGSMNTGSLTDVRSMFRNCESLESIDLSSCDFSNIQSSARMFNYTEKLATIYTPKNLSKTIYLYRVYKGTNGYLYGTLPRNSGKSLVINYVRELLPDESGDPLPSAGVTLSKTKYTYTGKALKPAVTVKSGDGTVLTAGTDYTVAYKNNVNAGTATVTVTGKGIFTGSIKKTFTIAKAAQSITAKAASKVAVGKTAKVTVTGAKGTKTFKSSNTAVATVTSAGKITAKKVGTVKITVTAKATANYKAASRTVTVKIVPGATSKLTGTNLSKGVRLTWARVTGANGYIIYRNNKKIKTITKGTTVTYADSGANTNGTKYVYKVVAKASTGESTLSKSLTFYRVARPSISSVKNTAAKKMTVKWGKNAKGTGYQIQYGLKSSFSGAKTVTVSKAATVSKVISGLTKGKTYYVRVRASKKVGSKTYYSDWSASKKLKITK